MSKYVRILAAALVAASLVTSATAATAPAGQVRLAPATRHAGNDQVTIPKLLNYQGKLSDSFGSPVPDSVWPILFALYAEPAGGAPFWIENQQVATSNGLFHVVLGLEDPIPSVPEFGELFLGMAVDTDPEMEPRVRIVSAAYAFLAARADTANYALAGGGGGTVSEVHQGTGILCLPNPITGTGTVRLDSEYCDDRYVRKQFAGAQQGSFWIDGTGQAQQFRAQSATAGANAIRGDGQYCGNGIYGLSSDSTYSYAAVRGVNAGRGAGVVGIGQGIPDTASNVMGGGHFTGLDAGCEGIATGLDGWGVTGICKGSSGIAVVGLTSDSTGLRTAGMFRDLAGNTVYVCYNDGATQYKINGDGAVATIMATRQGRKNLFAPEMPEPWFEDVGSAHLTGGHCRIDLDPLFADCINVSDRQPLRVFIQLEDNCAGVYVRPDLTGFDVHELQDGKSNARFVYRVLGKWKGNEQLRFPDAPKPPAAKFERTARTR